MRVAPVKDSEEAEDDYEDDGYDDDDFVASPPSNNAETGKFGQIVAPSGSAGADTKQAAIA